MSESDLPQYRYSSSTKELSTQEGQLSPLKSARTHLGERLRPLEFMFCPPPRLLTELLLFQPEGMS